MLFTSWPLTLTELHHRHRSSWSVSPMGARVKEHAVVSFPMPRGQFSEPYNLTCLGQSCEWIIV